MPKLVLSEAGKVEDEEDRGRIEEDIKHEA
jgi:hypothetical protein